MASRRDQLQSYQFNTQRVISAFVMREADPQQSPLRRGIGAIFGGVMIAIIVAAGFGIYGIFTRLGGDTWRSDGSVVIERETGAAFVYFDVQLHPTLNYTSALLAAGQPHPTAFRVPAAALTGVERGVTIGIPGAPTSLPAAARLAGLPWTLCTEPGLDAAGGAAGVVTLLVAGAPAERRPLAEAGMLVTDLATEDIYLVWQGHRHRLRDPTTVVPALFGAMVTAAPAGTSWLNALPAGVDIGPAPVVGRGERSPAIGGRDIGELLVAETGSGPQHYLVLGDGLAAITPLQAAIEAAHTAIQPTAVSISEANTAPRSEQLAPRGEEVPPPRSPPALALPNLGEGGDLLCAATVDGSAAPEVSIGGSTDLLAAANPTAGVSPEGTSLADRVHVPAGQAAVVRALASPGAETGTYHVVTDLGIRYPVPSPEVLPLLGYDPELAVDVPASLLNRVPAGPTLDPEAAIRPAGEAMVVTPG